MYTVQHTPYNNIHCLMYTVQCTQTILLRIQHKVVVVVVLASVEEIKLWITSLLGPSHGLKVGTVSGDKRGQFVDDVTQSVIWTGWRAGWGLAMEVGVGDLEYGGEDWRSRIWG